MDTPSLLITQPPAPAGPGLYEPSNYDGSTPPSTGRQSLAPLPSLSSLAGHAYTANPKTNDDDDTQSRTSQQTDYPGETSAPGAADPPPRVGVDPKAPFWAIYNKEAASSDRETTRGWTGSLDLLLIVTGIFSAIVTGFLAMELSPESSEVLANTLVQFLATSSAQSLLDAVQIPPSKQRELYNLFSKPPPPSVLAIATVTSWSTSLTCTLCIFLYAFYVKFWLHEYQRGLRNGSTYDCAQRRQARWDAMLKFKVEEWILLLPLLMHLAIIFFFLGLIMKLWSYHRIAGYVVLVESVLVFVVYMGLSVWPVLKEMCPYHNTPIAMVPQIFRSVWDYFAKSGRWMFRRILCRVPLPMSKWVDIDLEKGSLEAESTLPLYRAHPRVEREDNFVKRNWKDLTWNAVAWFLETSRQASTVDLALRSIRTLPYVPRKARELLSTRIPRLLYSKIVKEHEGDVGKETEEEANPKQVYEYTLSFIHILKCIALDAGNAGDLTPLTSLPTSSSSSAYRRLDESMMQAWGTYKTSPMVVDTWPIHNYVALISMEMLFYQIHPKTTTGGNLDPLHDMHFLLESHASQKKSMTGRSLALLLDSLVYVLARTQNEEIRQRTFKVLVQVVGTLGRRDCLVFRPLATCFKLLLTVDEEERGSILTEHVNAVREQSFVHGPQSAFRMLLDTLNARVVEQDSGTTSGILRSVFVLIANSLPLDVAIAEPIMQDNFPLLVNKLLDHSDKEWAQYAAPLWVAHFLCYVYTTKGHSEVLFELFGQLLASLQFRTEDERLQVERSVLDLVRARLNSSDAPEIELENMYAFLVAALTDNIRDSVDGKWTLVKLLAEGDWLVNLIPILMKMKVDTKIQGQALLRLWQKRMPESKSPLSDKQIFEMLDAVFTVNTS